MIEIHLSCIWKPTSSTHKRDITCSEWSLVVSCKTSTLEPINYIPIHLCQSKSPSTGPSNRNRVTSLIAIQTSSRHDYSWYNVHLKLNNNKSIYDESCTVFAKTNFLVNKENISLSGLALECHYSMCCCNSGFPIYRRNNT